MVQNHNDMLYDCLYSHEHSEVQKVNIPLTLSDRVSGILDLFLINCLHSLETSQDL